MIYRILLLSGILMLAFSCTSGEHKEEYRATLPDTIRFKISHDEDHKFWPEAIEYISQSVGTNSQKPGIRADEVWVDPVATDKGHQVYMKRYNSRDFVEYEMVWKYNGSTQNLNLIKEKIEKKAK